MQGTTAIKQYFSSGNSKNVTPIVSAEWNHNLFHAPYSTFSGTGTLISASSSWSGSKTIDALLGRTTSVFTDTSCVKLSTSSGTGASTTSIAVSSGVNTYKITFFAKLVETATVDLVALAYIDEHRSSSVSDIIDGASWKRFELIVSAKPTDVTYSSFNLTFDHTSSDGTMSYNVLIDQLEIYQTTAFDYQYGNLWQTKSPFGWFRPGESYVPSGNSLTPLPTGFRQIQSPISSSKSWTKQMPCSPIVYHPKLVGYGSANPLFKNGILSDYSVYRYWVSDGSVNSLGAVYDELLPTNKIVLKFNLAYSTPTDITLNLLNTVTGYSSNTTISYGDISSSGVCILYRQSNGTWSTTPWTTMPTISEQGAITNSQAINKVIITQNSYLVNSNYSTSSYTTQQQMGFFQVIEISPRLELDVTQFVINLETQAELDNKQNPLPISAISANHATVSLSNIPLRVNGGPLSVFSNNSSLSPLGGLLKRNVKFYINYQINDSVSGATSQNKIISNGVYYVDEWNERDIDSNDVVLYDITKYLQLLAPSDYVAHSAGVLSIISNLLDSAGFTDYDYDSLKLVTSSSAVINNITVKNSQPIVMQYFYADGQQQKLFDVLREIFEVYQIGAYIDSYGVMKFKCLDQIINNKSVDLVLHDSSSAVVITTPQNEYLPITSNIIPESYSETAKVKVGQAILKYRIPQVNKTESPTTAYSSSSPIDYIQKNDVLWTLESEESTTFNYLNQSINSYSQNYFYLDPSDLSNPAKPFNVYGIDHDGYAIIENEIVSFSEKEYKVTINQLNTAGTITGSYSKFYNVLNSADLKAAVAETSALAGFSGKINYVPTGKIVNVKRGAFGTPTSKHVVMSNITDLYQKLDLISGSTPQIINGQINLPINSVLAAKNETTNSYSTFSTKMLMGVNSGNATVAAVGGGLILNATSGSPIYVEITCEQYPVLKNGVTSTVMGYNLYVYQGTKTNSLLDQPFYMLDDILVDQAKNYPLGSPFEEFGKTIHLKFVKLNQTNNPFEIYVNKRKIKIGTVANLTVNTSGRFGIFSSTGNVVFSELYATKTALNTPSVNYYYELPGFSNTLAGGHKVLEPSYMMQSKPQVVGINYYDIKYSLAPSLNAHPVKVQYAWYYYTPVASTTPAANGIAAQNLNVINVTPDAMNYSNIYHSGFRGRFAIVNSSPASIWLKKTPDYKNPVDVGFQINTDSLVALSDEITLQKVFDPSNTYETIEISSNWIQSKKSAQALLDTIYKAVDGFSKDTQISIFGNPLIEIGDVITIQYSLKNLIGKKYFVQGIKQTFNNGLETSLTLNQIA